MQNSSVFARDAQGTSAIDREAGWQEKTNAAYQDAMKTVLSLATASLILPIVLVKTFASGGVPKDHITRTAYVSWYCLFLSILACMAFFLASAKYLKILFGGKESLFGFNFTLSDVELLRDSTVYVSILFFLGGIIYSFRFFKTLVAGGKPSSVRQSLDGDHSDRL